MHAMIMTAMIPKAQAAIRPTNRLRAAMSKSNTRYGLTVVVVVVGSETAATIL